MPRIIPLVLTATATGVMSWGWHELSNTAMDSFIQGQKGGRFQYLTIQGLVLAWITMVLGTLVNLFPGITPLNKLKRLVFIASMPLAVTISSIYWTLLIFFPSQIIKADPRQTEPSSSSDTPSPFRLSLPHDLSLHAAPGTFLLLDFLLFEKPYSGTILRVGAPILCFTYAMTYGLWVEYCATFNKTFPYPFLTENTYPVRIGIYAGASVIGFSSFYLINKLRKPALKEAKKIQ